MRKIPIAAAAFLLLCGFAEAGPVLPLPEKILPVPLVAQRTDFSCGDVSTLAVLRYFDFATWGKVPEKQLYKPLKTSSKSGTDPKPMAAFLNKQGIHAEVRTHTPTVEQLENSLDRGEPIIVAIQAWQAVPRVQDLKPWASDWKDGHWVVMVGHDAQQFYFMDPSTPGHYAYIPRQQFIDRWHDVVGAKNVQTPHISIFVRGKVPKPTPGHRMPPKVTIIN